MKSITNNIFPDDHPVMLAYDNINIHKGRPRHARLKVRTIPVMWNFTGKIAIKPKIEDVKHLFKSTKSSVKPQKTLENVKLSDLLLGE